MSVPPYLIASLPVFAVAAILFAIEWSRTGGGGDWAVNLRAWALQMGAAMVLLPLAPAWKGHGLFDVGAMPFWAGFALFALFRDFLEWAYHRMQHRVPFLWALHSLHHSDPAMGALTTMRHHWLDQFIKQLTIWSAAAILLQPSSAIIIGYALISLWNFMAHSALPMNFGRWSWLLNSSDYHRIHHSSRPEDYDINFAALFPIFDLLAGTYRRPHTRPETGLDTRPESLLDIAAWPLRSTAGEKSTRLPNAG